MKYRRTRLNSEVSYSEKDFICRKTHDKKKQEVKPKISGEKNVSTKMFRVFSNWGLALSTPFVLRQALREYPLFFKVKIYSGTDNFQTTLRQLERYLSSAEEKKRAD